MSSSTPSSSFKSGTDKAMSVVKYSGITLLGLGLFGYVGGSGFGALLFYGGIGFGMLFAGAQYENKVHSAEGAGGDRGKSA